MPHRPTPLPAPSEEEPRPPVPSPAGEDEGAFAARILAEGLFGRLVRMSAQDAGARAAFAAALDHYDLPPALRAEVLLRFAEAVAEGEAQTRPGRTAP